ncbi:SpoIIE family protein phosphatase [Streptomyces sp. NPDC049906]|uniref:SpoIIE family protein phosphatase n=1 Tax=Streptomyces sp. NPDC049906 TaxID=3155656 RepID=UPI00341E0A1A
MTASGTATTPRAARTAVVPGAPGPVGVAATRCVERALRALPSRQDPLGRLRSVVEQVLVFARATLTAVYVPDPKGATLTLVESAGVPRSLYGLHDHYPTAGDSPMAAAHRLGTAQWRTALGHPGGPAAERGTAVAALPLDGGLRGTGCLFALTERPEGFGPVDREVLALLAAAVGRTVPAPARPDDAPGGDGRTGTFGLAMDSGRLDADERLLALFGMSASDFDGRVETLLALTLPEDLPTLMSVVEADHLTIGDRELDFRVRRSAGEPRWLRLRGQVVTDGLGGRSRLIGTVADAEAPCSGSTDAARVQRLAAVLANTATVHETSQAVVGGLRGPLHADRVALAALDGERLVITALDPPDPRSWPENWRTAWCSEWPDAPVRALPTLAAAIREGRPALLESTASLEPQLTEVGPGALAVLPLPSQGRTTGLCLVGWDTTHRFGADERAFLTAASGLAGQALARVRAADAEHELVGTLQRSLLPRRLPDIPGGRAVARYLPTVAGLEVGGDWYDVIPLPDRHVALVIGDVQGHNATAATLMGQMRTALRAYAIEGHPPEVVVAHANRLLLGMDTDLFVTCCYVDVAMDSGAARWVSAGHLPPVLRHPDGATEAITADVGPPLGVVPGAAYPTSPLHLRPGTLLALTTDGLVESATCEMDVGVARLRDALTTSDPAHLGLVADTLLDDANRGDDVALLLLRYDGPLPSPS